MTRLGVAGLVWGALAGCATVEHVEPVPVGVDFQPSSACVAQARFPQVITTSPAIFSQAMWLRDESWEVPMRFRLDAEGAPHVIRASGQTFDRDREERDKAATEALEHYRFCSPMAFSTAVDWSTRMRFMPLHGAATGGGHVMIQLFLPAYSRDDVAAGRAGTNRVVGTFGQDGHPTAVRLSSSSGDEKLDHKSLEAMASYLLVLQPGTVLTRPPTFEQPFAYTLRR